MTKEKTAKAVTEEKTELQTADNGEILLPEPEQKEVVLQTLIDLPIVVKLIDPLPDGLTQEDAIAKCVETMVAAGSDGKFSEEEELIMTTVWVAPDKREELVTALQGMPGVQLVQDELDSYVQGLHQALSTAHQRQDWIYSVTLHSRDKELFTAVMSKIMRPEAVEQLPMTEDDTLNGAPQIAFRSQVESQWLGDYFSKIGFFAKLQSQSSPVVPNYGELKLLYLFKTYLDVLAATPQIQVPNGGAMDPLRLLR